MSTSISLGIGDLLCFTIFYFSLRLYNTFTSISKSLLLWTLGISVWVIPCQINKEFRVTSRILTKLGVFVVPMVLITHANF